jgi:hypothetical protein
VTSFFSIHHDDSKERKTTKIMIALVSFVSRGVSVDLMATMLVKMSLLPDFFQMDTGRLPFLK